MPYEASATPYLSVEGEGVTITGVSTGGDSDVPCTHVGYGASKEANGDDITPAAGGYGTVYPAPGTYSCLADFTSHDGGWHRQWGNQFTVTAKP